MSTNDPQKAPMNGLALFLTGAGIGWLVGLSGGAILEAVVTSLMAAVAGVLAVLMGVPKLRAQFLGPDASAWPVTWFVLGLAITAMVSMWIFGCTPCGRADPPPDPLVGAWLIVETRTATPDSTWVDRDPQPGIYLFTESHFSNMLIQGGPREEFPPAPTPEQRLAAYDPFIADAGSYVRTDSTLVTRNRIAKVPNVMSSGIRYHYGLAGDTLILSFSEGWAPPGGRIAYRLTRLGRGLR